MLGLAGVPGRGAFVAGKLEGAAELVCEPGPSGSSLAMCGGNFGVLGTCILTVFGVAPAGGTVSGFGLSTASALLLRLLLPGKIFFSTG